MCKTYDAIYEIKKSVTSDILWLWIDGAKVKGTLVECGAFGEDKCLKDVITLKDATLECKHCDEKKEFKWLNIPSMWIKAFVFDCCVK